MEEKKPQEKSKLQDFYETLSKENYKLPDYQTFETTLKDPVKSKEFYDALTTANYKLPDYDTFTNTLGLKKKDIPYVAIPSKELLSEMLANSSSENVRADGTPKGKGYFGELKRPDGDVSTELSIGVNIDGKETEIPTLVPTLTEDEKQYLLSTPPDKLFTADTSIFKGIEQKAVSHAKDRISQGKSPFAEDASGLNLKEPTFSYPGGPFANLFAQSMKRNIDEETFKQNAQERIDSIDKELEGLKEFAPKMNIGAPPYATYALPTGSGGEKKREDLIRQRNELAEAITSPKKREWFASRVYNNTIVGLASKVYAEAITGGKEPYQLSENWLSKYDPTTIEDISATVLGFVADNPLFTTLAVPGKAVAEEVAMPLAKKLMNTTVDKLVKSGVSKEIAEKYALKGAERFLMGTLSSATSLGGYTGLHDALGQWADPTKDFKDIDFGQTLSATMRDATLGAGVGFLGSGVSAVAQKAKAIPNVAGRVASQTGIQAGGLTAESALFVYGGALLDDRKMKDVSAQEIVETALLLGTMKLSHAIQDPKMTAKGIRQSMAYDPQKPGQGQFQVDIEPWELNSIGGKDYNSLMKDLSKDGDKLSVVMQNPSIPVLLKQKLLWGSKGLAMERANLTADKVVNNGEFLEFYNKEDVLVDKRKFATKEEAVQEGIKLGMQLEDNKMQARSAEPDVDKVKIITDLKNKGTDIPGLLEAVDKPVEERTPEESKKVGDYYSMIPKPKEGEKAEEQKLSLGDKSFVDKNELFKHLEDVAVNKETGELDKTWFDRELNSWPDMETVKAINEWTEVKKAEVKAREEARVKEFEAQEKAKPKAPEVPMETGVKKVAQKEMDKNGLIDEVRKYSDMSASQKKKNAMMANTIRVNAQRLGYEVKEGDEWKVGVTKDGKFLAIRKDPVKVDKARIESQKLLTEQEPEFQQYVNDVLETNPDLYGVMIGGLSNAQRAQAFKDIKAGKKTTASLTALNELERMYKTHGGIDVWNAEAGESVGVSREEITKAKDELVSRGREELNNYSYQDADILLKKGLITKIEYDEITDYIKRSEEESRRAEEDFDADISGNDKGSTEKGAGEEVKSKADEKPEFKTNKQIGDAFNSILDNMGRDDLEGILMNWNDSELSPDGTKIKQPIGRDNRWSKGKEGGMVGITKKDFINWLLSDEPFNETTYGKDIRNDAEWIDQIQRGRQAIGYNAEPPKPTNKPDEKPIDKSNPPDSKGEESIVPGSTEGVSKPVETEGKGKPIGTPEQRKQVDAINKDYDARIADAKKELEGMTEEARNKVIRKASEEVDRRNTIFGDEDAVKDGVIKPEDQGFKVSNKPVEEATRKFDERKVELSKQVESLNKERESKIGEVLKQQTLGFEESPLEKRMREEEEKAVAKIDYKGFWKDVSKSIEEPQTKEEKVALMEQIESTVEKGGWRFEVDWDADPDFTSVNVYYKGESARPEEMPQIMKKVFDIYTKLLHESHENAITQGTPIKAIEPAKEAELSARDLSNKTVPELDNLINQLESGMKDVLAQGDTKRAEKLNELIGKVIDARNEVKAVSETPKPNTLNDAVSKYGWSAVKNPEGFWLLNPKGANTVQVKIKKGTYQFFDMAGKKLMDGRGQIEKSAEKLLKDYYYAKEAKAEESVDVSPSGNVFLKGKTGGVFNRVDSSPEGSFFALKNINGDSAEFTLVGNQSEAIAKRIFSDDVSKIISGGYKTATSVEVVRPGKVKKDGETWKIIKPIEVKLQGENQKLAETKIEGIKFKDKNYTDIEQVQDDLADGKITFDESKALMEDVRKFEDNLKKEAGDNASRMIDKFDNDIKDSENRLNKNIEDQNKLFMRILPPDIISQGNTVLWKQLVKVRDGVANWMAGKLQAGMASQTDALRWTANVVNNWYGGLSRTERDIMGKLKMTGTVREFAPLEAQQIRDKLLAVVNSDPESLRRVRDALDPEIATERLVYGDLSVTEKNLYMQLRDLNTWVHETNYANDFIPTETYLKFKDVTGDSKYIARMYDKYETMPEEISEFVKQGNNAIKSKIIADIYKAREEVDDWKKEHAITDPTYLTAKRVMQTIQNVAVKNYMEQVQKDHPDMIKQIKKGEAVPKGYTMLSSSFKWGPFRNRAVANHIVEDFTGFFFANEVMNVTYDAMKLFDRTGLNQFYKKFRTVYNPFVQTGNFTGNLFFSSIAGINPASLIAEMPRAIKDSNAKTAEYKALLKSGILGRTGITGDMKPIDVFDANPNPGTVQAEGFLDKARGLFEKADEAATKLYQGSDNVAKYAAYKVFRNQGLSHEQSVRRVYDAFQNYSTVGKIWDVASKTPILGNKFVKFQADLQRILLNGVTTSPLTTAGTLMLISVAGKMVSALSGETDEEQKIRESRKGVAKIPLPFGMSVPLSFKIGKSEFNVARYLAPLYVYKYEDSDADLAELSKFMPFQFQKIDRPALNETGYVPAFSDPTYGFIASIMADRDFRGISIQNPKASKYHNPNPTTEERIANVMNYVGRTQIPFYRSAQDMYDGITGNLDYYGRKRDWKQAILNNIIKVQEFDKPELKSYVERNIDYLTNRFISLSARMGDSNSAFFKAVKNAEDKGLPPEMIAKIYESQDKIREKRLQKSLDEQVTVMQELERITGVYKKWYPDDPFIEENFANIQQGKNQRFNVMDDIDLQKKYKDEYDILKTNNILKRPQVPSYMSGKELTEDQRKQYLNTYWSEYVRRMDETVGLTVEEMEDEKNFVIKLEPSETSPKPKKKTLLEVKASDAASYAKKRADMELRSNINK